MYRQVIIVAGRMFGMVEGSCRSLVGDLRPLFNCISYGNTRQQWLKQVRNKVILSK